ncbi:MAG: thermostable hemolysin [Gammaproteobacteria bacterium]|nr:thermostable hemolysin [Gammaproteobacteria bacterium]MDH4256913.1 thermostable hemolysin [Gammaproteobacteria bacterium]MDH5311426.1 thermostable hemolysin [Gammaproteobacteria bacterium]
MISNGSVAASQPELPAVARFAGKFQVADRTSPARPEAEGAIRLAYGRHFGARVAAFMPYLASYRSALGRGVLGYRPAVEEKLYLESYLELPIESLLERITGRPVDRGDIVEVGQFAVEDRGIVGPLFIDLAPFLRGHGYRWICFTATQKIRRLLERAGLQGLAIATAREDAVREHSDRWGTYYDNDPLVIVGSLDDPAGDWCESLGHHGRLLTAVGA